MRTHSLKPFDDGKYLSEEESLKLLESIPIPKDNSGSVNPVKETSKISVTENPDLESITLDLNPADHHNIKSQDEWITYWNNINDGRVFASMADYYQAFKQLKEKFEHGSVQEKEFTRISIDSLRKDFDWLSQKSWLVSSTKIKYQPNKEDTQIIHHYNCHHTSAIQQFNVSIPEYLGVFIPQVLDEPKGLIYLQTLFGTKDDKETIIQNLEFISAKSGTKIKIWTPSFKSDIGYISREFSSERASGFSYNNSFFHVYCNMVFSSGRSRGVHINIPPKSRGAP